MVGNLLKDGFSKINTCLYVRYCRTMSNASLHKRRIQNAICGYGYVSILVVDDKHNELSYHYCGRKQKTKNASELMKIPDLIEFF